MDIWDILGIEETKDKAQIQAAYRKKLIQTNPEDDPQGFMELRTAFEAALQAADTDQATSEEQQDSWDDSPIGLWMRRVDELYSHFSKRIDPEQWNRLLQADVCQNLDTKNTARDALLEYMTEHFFLPQPVVAVLDAHFDLRENMDELRENFPQAFLDVAILESLDHREYPPYEYLVGDDRLPFEDYLKLSSQLSGCIAEGDTQQGKELIKQMKATGIESPYLSLEEAKICCQEGHYEEAGKVLEQLLPEYEDLADVKLMKGDICFFLGSYEEAREEYSRVLCEEPLSQWGRCGLAKCYVKTGKLKEANTILCLLLQENPYDSGAEEWLKICNDLYIKKLEKERQENMADQEMLFELGWCYFQNGEYDKTLNLLQDVNPEQEHRIEYNSLMGRALLYSGDERNALEYMKTWEQILKELPDNEENQRKQEEQLPYVMQLQASIYENLGEAQEALSLVERIIEQNPRAADALRQKGQILYNMWDFSGAADVLTKSIEKDQSSHITFLLRAKAFFHMDYYGEAFDDCERSLELYPYELASYVYKIKILIEVGELDEARETIAFLEQEELAGSELDFLKGYLEEAEDHRLAAKRIYRRIIERETSEKRDAEGIFDVENVAEVYHHLAVLDYDEDDEDFSPVVELIDKGLACDGTYVPLLEMKAVIAQQCGRYEEALELYKKILKLAPGKIGTYGMIDGIYRDMDEWDRALDYANLQLEQTRSAYAYMRRGQIFTCLDRLEEAWADFQTAVKMDPDLEYAYNYMGVILEFQDQEEDALDYYNKAIRIGEQQEELCEEAYANAANLYCRRQEFEQAADLLQRAYILTGNTRHLYEQIEIFRVAGEFRRAETALQAYQEAEDLRKGDFLYGWERAHILRDEKKWNTALKLYDMMAKEPAAAREAGKILYHKGKYRKALKYFQKAIAGLEREHDYEEPDFAGAGCYLWAARACLKLGRKEDAALFARGGLEKIPADFETSLSHCLPMVYQLMGGLYGAQGDLRQARAWIEKALSRRTCDYCNYGCCIDALYELGILCEAEGQNKEALEYYKKGLKFAPYDSDLSCAAMNLE